jgi:hypothetical protein
VHRLAIELEQHVADEHAGRRRGAAARHADDEQTVFALLRRALILRKRDRLSGEPEVAALQPAVLDERRRGLPRDARGNDDAEAADRGGGRDAGEPTRRVEKRAAGEAVVHRRRRADHLIDRAAASGPQRPADHRHEPGARRDRVAPRSRDRDRDVPDTHGRGRDGDRRRVETGDAQHGEARRRIPAGERRVERLAVVAADVQAVLASERAHHRQDHVVSVHETAGGTPAALDLDDGRRDAIDHVGELIREGVEQIVRHARIVTDASEERITQTG